MCFCVCIDIFYCFKIILLMLGMLHERNCLLTACVWFAFFLFGGRGSGLDGTELLGVCKAKFKALGKREENKSILEI